jgi:hypothetical protein
MVLTLHALPQSSQVVPLSLQRGVSVTSNQLMGTFFALLDSMHVKDWVDIFKEGNYDEHDMPIKIFEPNLICHVTTVLP